jgi:hypothetical protein
VRRPLFPIDGLRGAEIYELSVAPGHLEELPACPPGTQKNLVLSGGTLILTVGDERPIALEEGDAVQFQADVPQRFENPDCRDAIAYLVVTRLGRAVI